MERSQVDVWHSQVDVWHSQVGVWHSQVGVWLIAILLLAFFLRIANLGGKSLWFDEAYSVGQAQREELAVLTHVDHVHPPLYYVALHYWIKQFGDSERSVRFPSLLASMASLGLLYLLANRLFNQEIALTTVALLAVSPLDIWYAQEARMHIFVATVGLLMAIALTWNGWRGALLLFLALAVGLYIDYTVLPLWVCLSAIWLAYWWRHGRGAGPFLGWLLPSLLAWLFYQPWWSHFFRFTTSLNGVHLFEKSRELFNLSPLTGPTFLAIMGLGGLCLLLAAFWFQHALQQSPARRAITVIVLAGFALFTLFMVVPRLYSLKRVVIIGWPLVTLLAAWLIAQLARYRTEIGQGLFAISLATTLFALLILSKDDWRSAVAYLNQHVRHSDVVWLDPAWNQFVYDYYQPLQPGQRGLWPRDSPPDENGQMPPAIWLIAERTPGAGKPSSASEAWLDENWHLVKATSFYRLEVRYYQPP